MRIDVEAIPIISVSYNSVELIKQLLYSIRAYYINPIYIVDGSDEDIWREIKNICELHENIKIFHFEYNIHHGPGMAWAFQNLNFNGPVLVLDSDICVLNRGFIEDLYENLKPEMYGVGSITFVNEGGFDIDDEVGAVPYLHPACMLINMDVVLKWPMPIKHGAPMIEPMLALLREGQDALIGSSKWLKNDFSAKKEDDLRYYIRHDWQGTVNSSGSYNLEEWTKRSNEEANNRLIILEMLSGGQEKILEIGCNNGLLYRACKKKFPERLYYSIKPFYNKLLNGDYGELRDIDELNEDFFVNHSDVKTWIYDQALEKSKDAAKILRKLRNNIRYDAHVVAVIPNSQHWSLLLRLLCGDLRYSKTGLLSPNHHSWFSKATMQELFEGNGFSILQIVPVINNRLASNDVGIAIKNLAENLGFNGVNIFEELQVDSYIINAKPIIK